MILAINRRLSINVGIGLGFVLAVVMSWTQNSHIGWAVLHGICGWFYVAYRFLGYGGGV